MSLAKVNEMQEGRAPPSAPPPTSCAPDVIRLLLLLWMGEIKWIKWIRTGGLDRLGLQWISLDPLHWVRQNVADFFFCKKRRNDLSLICTRIERQITEIVRQIDVKIDSRDSREK